MTALATGAPHGAHSCAKSARFREVLRPTRDEAASLQSRGRVKVAAAGETLSVQFKNLCVG